MDTASWTTQTATDTRANGVTIRNMGTASIHTLMEGSAKGCGLKAKKLILLIPWSL